MSTEVLRSPRQLRISASDPNDSSLLARIDWGDGTTLQTANIVSPYRELVTEHEFTEPGVYSVFVSVSNGAGGYASATLQVTATGGPNEPPTLECHCDAANGSAPLVRDRRIDAADPDGDPLRYKVDFGDGSEPVTGSYPAAAQITHTFDSPGTYLVKALVSDGALSAAETTRVTVVLPEPLTANAGDDRVGTVGETVTFDGSGSRPSALIDTYAWDFGDGGAADGRSAEHTFTRAGTYEVKLTTTIGDSVATDSATVTVNPDADGAGAARAGRGFERYGFARSYGAGHH